MNDGQKRIRVGRGFWPIFLFRIGLPPLPLRAGASSRESIVCQLQIGDRPVCVCLVCLSDTFFSFSSTCLAPVFCSKSKKHNYSFCLPDGLLYQNCPDFILRNEKNIRQEPPPCLHLINSEGMCLWRRNYSRLVLSHYYASIV